MPGKSKAKEAMEDEASPPLRISVRIEHVVANPSLSPRIGHTSFVHPRTGILYLIGGCDIAALAPPLKASDAAPPPSEPMPLVEQCDPAMWFPPQSICETLSGEGGEDGSMERHSEKQQNTMETSNVQPGGSEKARKSNVSQKATSKLKNDDNKRTPKNCELEEKAVDTDAGVEKLPVTPEVEVVHYDVKVPGDFAWPSLAAIAVHWKEHEYSGDSKGETVNATKTEETDVAELPSVYFIGGWSGDARVSSVVGADLSTGLSLAVRCGNLFGIPPVTCGTATLLADCVYVFGGNAAAAGVAVMDALDLSAGRWIDRPAAPLPGAPAPRSSHVAAPLFGRYIFVHGGRKLSLEEDKPQEKGKKPPKRVDPKTTAAQPILPANISLCGDSAVFDVVGGRWAQVAVTTAGPAPRYAHAACALSECEVLLHGGVGAGGAILADMWMLHAKERAGGGLSLSWLRVEPRGDDSDALPARCYHSMAAGGRRVFVTGGERVAGRVEGATDVVVMNVDPLSEAVEVPVENRRRDTTKGVKRR